MRIKWFNSLSIRLTILLFFVSAISVIVAMMLFYTTCFSRLYQSHVTELTLMRDNRVQHLRAWVAEKKANFQYWHDVLFLKRDTASWTDARWRDIQHHMESFSRAHHDVRDLILIDAATGKILQSTVSGLTVGMDGSTQPEFVAAQKARAFCVGNIHVGPILKELCFSVSQPYFVDDNPAGKLWVVLILRIELNAWRSFFVDGLYGGHSTEVGILDENLNSLNPDHWKGDTVQKLKLRKDGLAYRAWSRKDTDVAQGINYKGVAVLGAYTYIPELKWVLLVNQDIDDINAVRYDLLWRLFLWAPLMILVVWLLAAFAAHQITRFTTAICSVMDTFKKGDLTARNHSRRQDEFGHIARSFDETADRVVTLMQQLESERASLEREVAARTAETRLQAHAMDNTADGVMICNADFHIVYVNAAYERMCGYSRDELLGQQSCQIMGGDRDEANRRRRDIEKILETERGWRGQFSSVRKDGTSYIRETSVTAIRDQHQTVQYYVTLSRDVTHEVQRQNDLVMLSNAMMQTMDCQIIVTLDDGRIVYVNHAYEAISGCTREEVLGKTVFETNAGHGIDAHLAEAASVVRQGQVWHKIYTNRRKDGSSYIEEDVVSPVRNKEGAITHCVVCARDITMEMQRVDELKRMKAAIEQSTGAVIIFDRSWKIIYVNDAYEHLSGLSRAEMVGRSMIELQQGKMLDADAVARFLHAVQRGHEWAETFVASQKSGNSRWLHMSVSYIRNDAHEIVYCVAWVTDVTADVEKNNQVLRLAHIVDHMQSGIQIVDKKFRIFYSNPAFYRISGTCAEEILGRTPAEACPFLFYTDATTEFLECLQRGEIWSGEAVCKRADGAPLVLYMQVSPVFDGEHVVQGYVSIFQDITHDKQLEQQLMQSQKLDTLGRLTGGVVHDFNNMLQGILGFAELLGEDLPQVPNMRSNLQEIIKCAGRARELTQQLLLFGRKQVEHREALNMNVQIEELYTFLVRVLGSAFTIELTLDSALRVALIDRAQFNQIMMNLVLNARDAVSSCATKWIGIHTRNVVFTEEQRQGRLVAPAGNYVCLSVADKGVGISKENVAKIFEPFFTTKGEGHGTGLGLSVVLRIVEAYGGWIAVETEKNQGTTFHVYLPACAESEHPMVAIPSAKDPVNMVGGRGELVLYVESEEVVHLLNERIMTTDGYRVLFTSSVDEAMILFQQNREAIKIVFFDVLYVGDTGVSLVSRLRDENPRLPILLSSGLAISKLIGFSHNDALCMFLQKPFSKAQLLTAIRTLLDRAQA